MQATMLYPMGFPLRITSDSQRVLRTAEGLWARYPKTFEAEPARIRISVTEPRGAMPGQAPMVMEQSHLLTIQADRGNMARGDLARGIGHVRVSGDVAADAEYLAYHFLEPLAYVLIGARNAAFLHASCVALEGEAVILAGTSGAGKTCLAYACARRGWTFISGDAVAASGEAVAMSNGDLRIAGRPFEIRFRQSAAELFPELQKLPRSLRPSGKTDIQVDPCELGVATAVESNARHLVFLARGDGTAEALQPMSSQAAARELEDGIRYGDAAVRARHARILGQLAQLPAWRLSYSNLDAAEETLRQLLRGSR